MKRSVYIETTIPSFYYEVRTEPIMVARRESTRCWWTEEGPSYALHTSAFVIGELQEGDYPGRQHSLGVDRVIAIIENCTGY